MLFICNFYKIYYNNKKGVCMKILKNQYFFFIILSALMLILGFSFLSQTEKTYSAERTFHIRVAITNYDGIPLSEDISFGGKTIYAAKPTITAGAGTTDSAWVTAKASYNGVLDTGWVHSSSATQWANTAWWVNSYSYNTTYYELTNTSIRGYFNTTEPTNLNDGWLRFYNPYVGVPYYLKLGSDGNDRRWQYTEMKLKGKDVTYYFCDTDRTVLSTGTAAYASEVSYAAPAPEGQHCAGWHVGSLTGSVHNGTTVKIFAESSTNFTAYYYAYYDYNTYTVKFSQNGGTGVSLSDATCKYGTSYTTPSSGYTKQGYKLVGWNTKANGSGTSYGLGDSYINLSSTHGDTVTLYAQWEIVSYNVKFNANGGSGTMANQTLTYGTTETLNLNTFTHEGSGACFGGWKRTSTGTKAEYSDGETKIFNLASTQGATVTLYAHWLRESYTIKYYLDYGLFVAGNVGKSQDVLYGDSLKIPKIYRQGYIFNGWEVGQNSKGTVDIEYVNKTKYLADKTITIPDWGNDGSTNTQIEVPLIGVWTPITYTVKFDSNGGSGTMTDMERTFGGDSITLPENTFTKEGYNFVGWSTSKQEGFTSADSDWSSVITKETWLRGEQEIHTDGENKGQYVIDPSITTSTYYQGSDIYFVTGSDEDPSPTWVTEDTVVPDDLGNFAKLIFYQGDSITLYAVWEAVDYTIVFDGNGAEGSMSNLAMIYDKSKTLTNNAYTRNGCLFIGWHRVKSAIAPEYSNKQAISKMQYYDETTKTYRPIQEGDEVKLYAIWKETWAIYKEKPSGTGTSSDPYLIATAQNLGWISWMYETGDLFDNGTMTPYFKQTANIDLSGREWLPIGNSANRYNIFGGTYDGNGYVIKNIQTNRITNVTRENIGLFGYSVYGTIKNVILFGNINGNTNVGGIVGYGNDVTLENCTNHAKIIGTVQAGGIAGYGINCEISSCNNYGDITSSLSSIVAISGGILANGYGMSITKCYSTGAISGYYAGGIAGSLIKSGNTISSCAFEGTVEGSYSGAFVGFVGTAEIKNSYAKAQVSSTITSPGCYGLYSYSENPITIRNCVFEIETNNDFSGKGCMGSDFSAWIISSDGRPLPSGLSWLATGGTKVTNISQITANYTQVS